MTAEDTGILSGISPGDGILICNAVGYALHWRP
jgi:hypothetical protein